MKEENEFGKFADETGKKLTEALNALKDKALDAAGDGAELVLQKLDETLEIVQAKIREAKSQIDEKTETDKPKE